MKKYLQGLLGILLSLTIGITSVDAAKTETSSIDSKACSKVYTNYYFLLDANSSEIFTNKKLTDVYTQHFAHFDNNSYQIRDFDTRNVGYGQMYVAKDSTTSNDGISSMSFNDFYTNYIKAMKRSDGTYTDGTKRYIVAHRYSNTANGTVRDSLDLSKFSTNQLANASLNASSAIYRISSIKNRTDETFKFQIDRNYYGNLASPIYYGNGEWYLQPAVYYIQYCEQNDKYTVTYDKNTNDYVSSMPESETLTKGDYHTVSRLTPRRSGYTFTGWSRDRYASRPDLDYKAGSRNYKGEDGDITLYAVWKQNDDAVSTYRIRYFSNTSDNVSNMPNNATIRSDEDTRISSVEPVRNGYTFLGWSTDNRSSDGNSNFDGGSIYRDRKDLDLYAIWQKNQDNNYVPDDNIPSNPQTGITDYLLPFGSVIGMSVLGLGVLKRKGFKQF